MEKQKTKQRVINFKYPLEVYVFWIISFVTGFELVGGVLVLFLREWGGLSQLQTQTLQSWFMFMIFLMEIPTGLIGDIKGRKFSVVCSYIFLIIGPVIYGLFPNFKLFLLSEAIFAIGAAFSSGAMEALMYDTVKEKGLLDEYNKINTVNRSVQSIGRLIAAPLGGLAVALLPVNIIFQLWAVNSVICLIILLIFIKEPEVISRRELVPDYKEVFKKSLATLRDNKKLQKLVAYMISVSVGGYFVLWLYQTLMLEAGVPDTQYGFYRILFMVGQMLIGFVLSDLLEKHKHRRLILIICGLLFGLVYILAGWISEIWTIVVFIVIGGYGKEHRGVFSKYLNAYIESDERSTTLSFISMFKRIILAVLNPFVGWAADRSLSLTLVAIGIFIIISSFVLMPNEIANPDS
ncbi:MFS transporter [Candidatus Dojkabacteria bacterium]|nr:MFS transporter [Candidatus Dojkabacteria bacterium]